jgi:peroxiredoxin
VQLQGEVSRFEQAGIAVATLTYDAPELQQKFIDKYGITYPVLSDIDATSIRNLGILDEDYEPGDSAYGIPHPGVFVVTSDGTIAGKIFIEGYEKRIDANALLAFAKEKLGIESPP